MVRKLHVSQSVLLFFLLILCSHSQSNLDLMNKALFQEGTVICPIDPWSIEAGEIWKELTIYVSNPNRP